MRKTLETAINGLKLWTERLVKRSADEVRGEIPAIPTPKQADWNQNDDTAIDHIKGRTHYERIGFKQIPIGTYNDHAPGYTDYNVGPYAWDYTNGITLRVDGVVYEFETFTKSDFDSNLGCYGYWVGAPLVRGQIVDSSEYPFHFRIFEKDNEYAHVEFADGTDNHTFEVFCTEIKQLDEKYIPDSIARKSDIPQGGGSADIPDTLPNPHPLTFTGAVEATYDGSTPVEVEIPMGGAGGGEWELIKSVTLEEDVRQADIDLDGEYTHVLLQYKVIAGAENQNNTAVMNIFFNRNHGREMYNFVNTIYKNVTITGYFFRLFKQGWFAPVYDGKRYDDTDVKFSISSREYWETVNSVTFYSQSTTDMFGIGSEFKIYGVKA